MLIYCYTAYDTYRYGGTVRAEMVLCGIDVTWEKHYRYQVAVELSGSLNGDGVCE
jgi:hypothetical protein